MLVQGDTVPSDVSRDCVLFYSRARAHPPPPTLDEAYISCATSARRSSGVTARMLPASLALKRNNAGPCSKLMNRFKLSFALVCSQS